MRSEIHARVSLASTLRVLSPMNISRLEITRGQIIPPELEYNLNELLARLNRFRVIYGKPMNVTSGFRSEAHNKKIGGAPGSAHLSCQAADFHDPGGALSSFCLSHLYILEDCGLWMENPLNTPTWVHLQSRPAHKRVFIP